VRLTAIVRLGALGAVCATAAACGAPTPRLALFPDSVPRKPHGSPGGTATALFIDDARVPGFGDVLVDEQGHTLYAFTRDRRRFVTCAGPCATVWLPALLAATQVPVARGRVRTRLLSSFTNPTHGSVASYDDYPLYAFAGDRAAGQARGQGRFQFGGRWWVVSVAGTLVRRRP
jgi:predicted lipoprotein with Yx(FWY)xxD motif